MGSSRKNKFLIFFIITLALLSSIYLYFNWGYFSYGLFDNGPQISSPTYYKTSDNGDQYYIDKGNFRIVGINDQGKSKWTHTDTNANYKELAVDSEGEIYATNYHYVQEGAISSISIDRLSNKGKFLASIYTESYNVEDVFDMTSQIMDLRISNGELTFVTRTDEKVLLYSINLKENNSVQLKKSVSWDDLKEHAIKYSYDDKNEVLYIITGIGNVYKIDANNNDVELLEYQKEEGFNIPYSMALVDGRLLVSDIGSRTIKLFDGESFATIKRMVKDENFNNDPALYYSITDSGDNKISLVSSFDTLSLDIDSGGLSPINTNINFSAEEHIRIILTWICGLLLFILGIGLIILFSRMYYKKVGFTDFTYNFMMVVIIIAISALIIVNYTNILYKTNENKAIEKISSIGSLIARNISAEDVQNIDKVEDYTSQSYENIVRFLNNNLKNLEDNVFFIDETSITKENQSWNEDFYIGINKIFDDRMYLVLATPEELGAIYPLDIAEKEGIDLLKNKNMLIYPDYVGYFGSFILVQVPIISSSNELVGTVEVGFSKSNFTKEIRKKQREIIIAISVILLISILLLKEIFFWIKTLFAKRSLAPNQLIDSGSVRSLMFLGYISFYISIVCGPLFAMQLYSESAGVPKEIVVAIAYSSTFLFISIFSFVSSNLLKKISFPTLLIISTIIAIIGEITAATSIGLIQFIIGRSLFGAGVGMVLNSLETMVAMQPDEELVVRGFNMSSVGTNAGTLVGIALGSTVVTSFGFRGVYIASALNLLILLVTTILFYNKTNVPNSINFVEEVSDKSFFGFMRNKKIIAYMFFLAVPYFICIGFIDFFLPLEGTNQGLSVESISYIFIIVGLISIYLGPVLTEKLLQSFESYIVLIISSVIISTAIIYYGITQSVLSLLFSCIAIAFADSFFQTVQNVYFTQLPESIKYGQGAALAISNVVIGIATMSQAYVFALALIYSIKTAFLIIGGMFILLTILFLIFNFEKKGMEKVC